MAAWPYGTTQWNKLRKVKLADQPLCQPCERRGFAVAANHVDHVLAITAGGDPFPPLDGLMSMCPSCHAIKTAARDRPGGSGVAFPGCGLDGLPIDPDHPAFTGKEPAAIGTLARPVGLPRSRIPLILVCGAPGSGKTTYVRERASPRDLVIDLDVIRAGLSGLGIHAEASAWTSRALKERNRILASLSTDRRHERCWFILGGAKRVDRDHWSSMLGAVEVHIMDTPIAEIERRIWSDPTRHGRERLMVAWARRWFADFTP